MSEQTGLSPPVLGGAKPVCADIRTTPRSVTAPCILFSSGLEYKGQGHQILNVGFFSSRHYNSVNM